MIGGGYTGCSAALHLAESGIATRVLDAVTIGHGASGRNVGLVNAGLWLPPDDVEAALGTTTGRRLNDELGAGPERVFAIIDRYRIDCEPVRRGTLHCAHGPAGLAQLASRHAQARARGVPVELLDANAAARATGASGLHGALLDPRAGTIQPLAYVRGLARSAAGLGAQFNEHSKVTSLERRGTAWRAHCGESSVDARVVLVAANAYQQGSLGSDFARFTPMHYFQMATAPLAPATRAGILPDRQGAWDTAQVMSSFRMDKDGRLIIGGVGRLAGYGAPAHVDWAARKLGRLFPSLGPLPLEHGWYGRIALTRDRTPRVLRMGPNAYSIFGYNGRGIAPGTVLGVAFAEFVATGNESAFPLPPVDAAFDRFGGVKSVFYELGATAFHLVDAR